MREVQSESSRSPKADLEQQRELRERSHAAYRRFQNAANEYARIWNRWKDRLNDPAAVAALRRAAENEREAVENYDRAFSTLRDSVLAVPARTRAAGA